MERTEQGSPHEEGDMQDSPDLESKKKHEKNMNKTCFCDRSPVQVQKIGFLLFNVFWIFQVRRVTLKSLFLLPGRDVHEAFFKRRKTTKKREKPDFCSFFHHRTLVFQRHSQKKPKSENCFRIDSYS